MIEDQVMKLVIDNPSMSACQLRSVQDPDIRQLTSQQIHDALKRLSLKGKVKAYDLFGEPRGGTTWINSKRKK